MTQEKNYSLDEFPEYDPDDLLGQRVKKDKERFSKKEKQSSSLKKKKHKENNDDFL